MEYTSILIHLIHMFIENYTGQGKNFTETKFSVRGDVKKKKSIKFLICCDEKAVR